jgi:hypothetical protein
VCSTEPKDSETYVAYEGSYLPNKVEREAGILALINEVEHNAEPGGLFKVGPRVESAMK